MNNEVEHDEDLKENREPNTKDAREPNTGAVGTAEAREPNTKGRDGKD